MALICQISVYLSLFLLCLHGITQLVPSICESANYASIKPNWQNTTRAMIADAEVLSQLPTNLSSCVCITTLSQWPAFVRVLNLQAASLLGRIPTCVSFLIDVVVKISSWALFCPPILMVYSGCKLTHSGSEWVSHLESDCLPNRWQWACIALWTCPVWDQASRTDGLRLPPKGFPIVTIPMTQHRTHH